MIHSPDMTAFTSRLRYKGQLVFDSAHRIGAERSLAVDAPDLPVLRTVDGRPYIPGSSVKGAWRAYTESVLRTIQAQHNLGHKLACQPISEELRCLPKDNVKSLKDKADADRALRQASCWTCRIFGNGQIASKVMIKDLMIDEASFLRTEVRDGVAIDRDSARAADGFKYNFEAVPAGARFEMEILVENGAPAELGLVMIGLNSFARGDILLGGAKSRGLGWCHLDRESEKLEYITGEHLLAYLLNRDDPAAVAARTVTAAKMREWLAAFEAAIQEEVDRAQEAR